jgi:hypothetical protein
MASLANVTPGASYPGLLKTENNTGLTGSLQVVSDGSGNLTPLRISTCFITNYGNGGVTSNAVFGDGALQANTTGSALSAFGTNVDRKSVV